MKANDSGIELHGSGIGELQGMAAINDWLVVESNSQGETNEARLKRADGRMGANEGVISIHLVMSTR